MVPALLEIPGLTFYGITEPARFQQRVPTVAVRIAGRSPRELAAYLGERGIFTWDGNYYALNLSERLGVEPTAGCSESASCTTTRLRKLTACSRRFATCLPAPSELKFFPAGRKRADFLLDSILAYVLG